MKIKKLLLLFIILGTCMINSGCLITQEDYLRAAEKYMEKKYGEEFEGKYFYGLNNDSMYVVPKSNPNCYVSVKFNDPNLWNVKFHDNYVAFLVKEEVEKKTETLVEEIYGNCKIFCRPLGFSLPDKWNSSTQFEEYREHQIFTLDIFVSANPENRNLDLNKFKTSYYSLKVNFDVVNIVYVSEEQLHDLDIKTAQQIFSSAGYICRAFVMWNIVDEKADEVIYWNKGK